MKILIVDDEIDKATDISQQFSQLDPDVVFCHQTTSVAARLELRKSQYDLVVIDLNLPAELNSGPSIEGGFDLLDMLLADPEVSMPADIVFITAKEDLISSSREKALERGALLLEYANKDAWKKFISGKIRHLRRCNHNSYNLKADIAFITALSSPEFDAVLALDYKWNSFRLPGDPTSYYSGTLERGSQQFSIVAACANQKGMPSTTALTTKLAIKFSPKFIVMVGICAGVEGKVNLGDAIIADPSWDYGSGKYSVTDTGETVFLAAPVQCPLDLQIRSLVEQISRDERLIRTIPNSWDGRLPEGRFSAKLGPMASGAAVIADGGRAGSIALQQRELVAIEMEAYGVMVAADHSMSPKPTAIVIKSVCDFANAVKNDNWQSYSAYTSAAFANLLLTHKDFPL